jgi:hypothetical protein
MTTDEIECTEVGGTEPTVALLRRRAAVLSERLGYTSPGPSCGRGDGDPATAGAAQPMS